MDRRNFISQTAMFSAVSAVSGTQILYNAGLIEEPGIQFFSLPAMLEKDLPSTLAMLQKMGYKKVELYGPYSFSTKAAQERWNAVTPALGFKGSGYFGRQAKEMKTLLDDHGLKAPSMHTDLDTLRHAMPQLAEAAHQTNTEFVVLPAIPEENRKTPDDYKRTAEIFNKIGTEAKQAGVKFGYHNHGYGLTPVDGQVPLELILDNTDPALVFLEMDIFWTIAGGTDPLALLKKYKGRYRLMHIKDMARQVRFSGDGGDAGQWIELFPHMTTAGDGVLALKTLLPEAKKLGVEHFIVEQDMVASPETALKKSVDFLRSL